MRFRTAVLSAVIAFVGIGGVPTGVQYGGPVTAQAQGPAQAKGVTSRNLVTSLGGFRGTASVPIVLTGQVVEIEPGGQTGRQRHMVPSYVYVLEGILTTNSEGGPVGVDGVQYHGAGQSYMDAVGVWHNHSNGGTTAVKYLLLLISTPGGATTQKAGTE
jgi:quercetin dioxygenase-like cupin family protein